MNKDEQQSFGSLLRHLVAVGHAVRARTEGADPLRGKRLLLLRLRGECCRRHQLVELPCAGAVGFRQEEGAGRKREGGDKGGLKCHVSADFFSKQNHYCLRGCRAYFFLRE